MKRGMIVGALVLFLLPLLAWGKMASAQSFRSGDNVTVGRNETVDGSLWASGRTVDIAGNVMGDVFCAGMNISISGNVDGDVLCAGQTVRISGTVEGDVRAAGQTVTIGGVVRGNTTAATQTFTLEGEASVGRDASVAANDATFNGVVRRDLSVTGTTATLASRVGRNVQGSVERLRLQSQSRVGGWLTYTSWNEAEIADSADVTGATTKREPPQSPTGRDGSVFGFSFGVALYVILSLLIVALALVLLFPAVLHNTTQLALDAPTKTVLTGLAAGILAPVLIVSLMVTIVGAPLGLLLLLIWLVIVALSGPFTSYFVGRLLLKDARHPVLAMFVGSLLVLLLFFIPILGFITFLLTLWTGTGMILRELMRRMPKPAYDRPGRKK